MNFSSRLLASAILLTYPVLRSELLLQDKGHSYEVTDITLDTVIVQKDMPRLLVLREMSYDTSESLLGTGHRSLFKFSTLDNGRVTQTIQDSGSWAHPYEFVDVNFDGYRDFKIDADEGQLFQPQKIWLFDPKKNEFEYSSEFSKLYGLTIDADDKILTAEATSTGGNAYSYAKYTVEEGRLKLIEEVNSDHFDYSRDTLVAGRMIRTDEDRTVGSELDSQFVVVRKKLIFGSLRIVEINTMAMLKSQPSQEELNNNVAQEWPWGYYRYIQEQTFEYQETTDGSIKVSSSIRVVHNRRWEDIPSSLRTH